MKIIEGGVTAAKGFEAAATAAGIKYQGRTDMAIIYSEKPCKVAGTFTTNVVKAAPVKWDRQIVESKQKSQAVIVNSGIANACTGEEGMKYCEETAKEAGKVLGIDEKGVLVGSTGVIGMQIPIDKIKAGITELAKGKKADLASGTEAAKAIGMTHVQTMMNVILPQALRNIMPQIGNNLIINIKDTCVLSIIGIVELFYTTKGVAGAYYTYFESFTIAMVMYFILTFVCSRLLRLLEHKMEGPQNYDLATTDTLAHTSGLYSYPKKKEEK